MKAGDIALYGSRVCYVVSVIDTDAVIRMACTEPQTVPLVALEPVKSERQKRREEHQQEQESWRREMAREREGAA
jgi:hypothetical protein